MRLSLAADFEADGVEAHTGITLSAHICGEWSKFQWVEHRNNEVEDMLASIVARFD
jgi:hypothetical protein